MASIIKRTNASGVTYAYRSEARWDPEKGYSVPKQTYLGRVDDITGEIIPTSRQRGRKKSNPEEKKASISASDEELVRLKKQVQDLNHQIVALTRQNGQYQAFLRQLQGQIDSLLIKS